MACRTTDSTEAWIELAEQRLHALVGELRRAPLGPSTIPLHVRALDLKREVGRWRHVWPETEVMTAVIDEISGLTEAAQLHRRHRTAVLAPRG